MADLADAAGATLLDAAGDALEDLGVSDPDTLLDALGAAITDSAGAGIDA